MKKLLLLMISCIVFSINANAQCTAAAVGNPGIYPDSATNFLPAYIGQAYNQIITVKVPADTMGIPITKIILNSLTGLPMGLSYACNPSNCQFPGNATNCAAITGIPDASDTIGTYTLHITVTPYVGTGAGTAYAQQTLTYYRIVLNPYNAIESLNPNKFSVSQNTPNPCSTGKTTVYFTMPVKSDVDFKLFNAIGNEVLKTKIAANEGTNEYELKTVELPSGIYLYSLNNGQAMVTKRLSITK